MDILGVVDVPGWLLTIAMVILTLYLYTYWCQSVWSSLGVPGPRPIPYFGINLLIAKKGMVDTYVDLMKKHGRNVGIYHGNVPALLTTDPDVIQSVMVKEFSGFSNRFIPFELDKLIRGSVSVVENEHWKFLRSTLSPTFSSGKMRNMVPMIHKCVDTLINNVKRKSEGGKTVDMKQLCGGFTMDVIASTAFGIEVDSQNNENSQFVKMGGKLTSLSLNSPLILIQMMFPVLRPVLKHIGVSPLPQDVLHFFADTATSAIEERKAENIKRGDFLELMTTAHKERKHEANEFSSDGVPTRGLNNEEILSNSTIFFVAGYDTTANTLSFAVYSLVTNLDWQDKIIEEIDTVIGKERPDYDNVSKLANLDMFLSEVLRLYGPAVRTSRRCDRDTTVKGIHIPKGVEVGIPLVALHRDPEFWPDPLKFDPTRFSKENKDKIKPYTYLPFGSGPRNCIGQRLAQMEMRMALVTLLQNVRFVKALETQIPIQFTSSNVLRPKDGVKVKVELR